MNHLSLLNSLIDNKKHISKELQQLWRTQYSKGVRFIITKITMRLVRTLTKLEQQFQLQTHLKYTCNNPKKKTYETLNCLNNWVHVQIERHSERSRILGCSNCFHFKVISQRGIKDNSHFIEFKNQLKWQYAIRGHPPEAIAR